MRMVDEQPETIHIYVFREEATRPPLLPIVLSVLALSILIAVCVFSPYQQPVSRAVIRVPAVPLDMKTFTARVAIVPTGVRVYPATTAHGVLTITNGSIIGQSIPADFTIQGVVTDSAVYVPGGNANGYGWAQVLAHALTAGKVGNLPALAINSVIGSSVYVRNLTAFRGGRDAYSVTFVTAQDRQTALEKARQELTYLSTGLHYPCKETISGAVTVAWHCQFVTYRIPALYHVTGVSIIGKNLLIDVWFVARPTRIWVK